MNELVSVIVPLYNVEHYIRKCVMSVLDQTYKNFELLLIDDGSTDKSGQYCDEFGALDPRVKVMHKKNGGQSEARNMGLDYADGRFIFFLDSDDWIEPEALAVLMDQMDREDADMICCSYRLTDENGEVLESVVQEAKTYSMEEAVKAYVSGTAIHSVVWGKLYKKELFDSIRFPASRVHEDDFISYQLVYASRKITTVSDVLYNYFQRQNSIMHEAFSAKRLIKIDAARDLYHKILEHGEKEVQHIAYIRYIEALQSMYVCSMKYLDQSQLKSLDPYKDEIYRECKKAYHFLGKEEIPRRELFLISYCPLYYQMYRLIRRLGKKMVKR